MCIQKNKQVETKVHQEQQDMPEQQQQTEGEP